MNQLQDNPPSRKVRTHTILSRSTLVTAAVAVAFAVGVLLPLARAHVKGGSNTTPTTSSSTAQNIDSVKVSKAYTNATATSGGELLIKAASSNATARLFAYRTDGTLIGEVQNGGGGRYGGTVMPDQALDPVTVTITSSLGGSITVPTTPFQL